MKIRCWFLWGLTSLISMLSKGLSNLLQQHNSKASTLRLSAFFMVQLSHLYITTGKTIALAIQIFVSKVMSLLFNMLSRFVIVFFQGASIFKFGGCSHHLQWFLEPPKNIICHCFPYFPFYFAWSNETRCHDLRFLNFEFDLRLSFSNKVNESTR